MRTNWNEQSTGSPQDYLALHGSKDYYEYRLTRVAQHVESRKQPRLKELLALQKTLAQQVEEAESLFCGAVHELQTSKAALKHVNEMIDSVQKHEAA
jgi:hypothetical protein